MAELLLPKQTARVRFPSAPPLVSVPPRPPGRHSRATRWALWARFARGERLGAEDPLEFLALRG